VLKKKDIQRDLPGITQRKFLYNLSKASYEKEWGKSYQRPGMGTRFLAFIIRVIPKIGPLRVLSFRTPTPETEKMFMASFNAALDDYRHLLADVGAGHLDLPNLNFDTGSMIQPGTYFMQDEAYARLLSSLEREQFKQISPELRSNILAFFGGLGLPAHIKRDKMEKTRVDWKTVPQEVEELKSLPSDSKLTEGQNVNQVRFFVVWSEKSSRADKTSQVVWTGAYPNSHQALGGWSVGLSPRETRSLFPTVNQ
jgi:hypothetical protein